MKYVIGHTRTGRPIFAIAGGSEDAPPPSSGDTITVEDGGQAPQENPGEQRPATPAPTRQVDPGAFNRGVDEQQRAGEPVAGQTQNPTTGRVFTEAEVEAIRQQEKDKVYGRVDELTNELKTLREEREREQREREEAEARAAEEARNAEENDLDVRELIRKKEEEWNNRFNEVQSEAEKAQALLEQERRYNALKEYTQKQLEAHEDDIMPHLRPYVQGNTEEEIQASIQQQIETTRSILSDLQAAQQQQRQQVPSTRVTAPGDGGPLEQTAGAVRTYTAEEINNMTPAEFAKHRDALMAAAVKQGPYGGR